MPEEITEEARRCPTCESLHHHECDPEILRADEPAMYFCVYCRKFTEDFDHSLYCYLNPGRKSDKDRY